MSIKVKMTGLDKLQKIVDSMEDTQKKVTKGVQQVVGAYTNGLIKQLQSASPVGTGYRRNHDRFHASWRATANVVNGSTLHVRITNKSIQAPAIEFGSDPGNAPWPSGSKGQKKEKGKKTPSGKTVYSQGKVWSTQAVGGVIRKVIPPNFQADLTNSLRIKIVKSIIGEDK